MISEVYGTKAPDQMKSILQGDYFSQALKHEKFNQMSKNADTEEANKLEFFAVHFPLALILQRNRSEGVTFASKIPSISFSKYEIDQDTATAEWYEKR